MDSGDPKRLGKTRILAYLQLILPRTVAGAQPFTSGSTDLLLLQMRRQSLRLAGLWTDGERFLPRPLPQPPLDILVTTKKMSCPPSSTMR